MRQQGTAGVGRRRLGRAPSNHGTLCQRVQRRHPHRCHHLPGVVHVINCGQGGFVGADVIAAVFARFAQAHSRVFAHGGHWLHVEQPTLVATTILAVTEFAATFAEDVLLEASVLRSPLRGRHQVSTVMVTASATFSDWNSPPKPPTGGRPTCSGMPSRSRASTSTASPSSRATPTDASPRRPSAIDLETSCSVSRPLCATDPLGSYRPGHFLDTGCATASLTTAACVPLRGEPLECTESGSARPSGSAHPCPPDRGRRRVRLLLEPMVDVSGCGTTTRPSPRRTAAADWRRSPRTAQG